MIRTTKPEVVQAVRDRISQEDVEFDMSSWGVSPKTVRGHTMYGACGTAACIAGHALLATRFESSDLSDVEKDGSAALGLTGVSPHRLFYTAFWPQWSLDIRLNCGSRVQDTIERQIAIELLDAILEGADPWDRNYRPKRDYSLHLTESNK